MKIEKIQFKICWKIFSTVELSEIHMLLKLNLDESIIK